MKLLYTDADTFAINHLFNLLQQGGVNAEVRNQYLSSAMGELPPGDTMPQLWVDSGQYERAQRILHEAQQESDMEEWQCPQCSEQIEGVFGQCWKCGYKA